MISIVILIYPGLLFLGIANIVKDPRLSSQQRVMWLASVCIFNILAVVIYRVTRILRDEKG